MNIAIIPARAGSKRIPKKNIREFLGKPIINYAIETAIKSKLFDRVIVSTDSKEIANVAEIAGAEIPFIRPDSIADDHTVTADVILHALNELGLKGEDDYVCCIYSTAVFMQVEYLKKGFDIIKNKNTDSVFSVTSFPFPIFRSLKIKNDRLEMFWPEHMNTRSNDLEDAYHDVGQFYWLKANTFIKKPVIYTDNAMPVILPRNLTQDIDTEEDWINAEYMYTAMKLKTKL